MPPKASEQMSDGRLHRRILSAINIDAYVVAENASDVDGNVSATFGVTAVKLVRVARPPSIKRTYPISGCSNEQTLEPRSDTPWKRHATGSGPLYQSGLNAVSVVYTIDIASCFHRQCAFCLYQNGAGIPLTSTA